MLRRAKVALVTGRDDAAVLALLLVAAAWRMRRDPGLCTVLLPFVLAILANSAGSDPPVAALAVPLFAFRWAPRDQVNTKMGRPRLPAVSVDEVMGPAGSAV